MTKEEFEGMEYGTKLYVPTETKVLEAEFWGFKLDGRVWLDIDGAATVAPTWCLYRTKRKALKVVKGYQKKALK